MANKNKDPFHFEPDDQSDQIDESVPYAFFRDPQLQRVAETDDRLAYLLKGMKQAQSAYEQSGENPMFGAVVEGAKDSTRLYIERHYYITSENMPEFPPDQP